LSESNAGLPGVPWRLFGRNAKKPNEFASLDCLLLKVEFRQSEKFYPSLKYSAEQDLNSIRRDLTKAENY
jgi:hypothetical protein